METGPEASSAGRGISCWGGLSWKGRSVHDRVTDLFEKLLARCLVATRRRRDHVDKGLGQKDDHVVLRRRHRVEQCLGQKLDHPVCRLARVTRILRDRCVEQLVRQAVGSQTLLLLGLGWIAWFRRHRHLASLSAVEHLRRVFHGVAATAQIPHLVREQHPIHDDRRQYLAGLANPPRDELACREARTVTCLVSLVRLIRCVTHETTLPPCFSTYSCSNWRALGPMRLQTMQCHSS